VEIMRDSESDDLQPPASLAPVDRQQLILLHKVLEHLDVDEADYHRRMSEVLTQGFTLEYESVFSAYAELPRSDCKLVMNVLDMFRVITASLVKLDPAERDPLVAEYGFALWFQGFDGNDAREGKMGSYVTYLQSTDRWSDLQEDVDAADGGNSHSLMLDRYAAMLEVYRPLWEGNLRSLGLGRHHLDVEQLRQIAEARVH
jgi:uncharacterized protein YfbU (UPF0304 family)